MTELRSNMIKRMTLRKFTPKTIKSYVWAVKGIAAYYRKSPDLLSDREVQDYLYAMLKERHWSWNTLHLAVYGLKYFYHDFLHRPRSKFYIPCPKKQKRLPVIWSPEEIKQLLAAAPNLQIQTMLKTAYASGLRLGELVRLKVGDIDSPHMTLWVRSGKGDRDRAALLTPSLLRALRIYWKAYRPKEWLFPKKQGPGYLRPESFATKFRELRRKVNPHKKCGTHSLRHSFATHQFARGADIYTVQKLLGHRRVESTMIYVHLSQGILLAKADNLDLLSLKSLIE